MKFWLMAPWVNPEDMIELAVKAEEVGFEGIMGADHGFIPQSMHASYPYTKDGKPPINGELAYPEVWTTIAAMAAVTKTIKFSCGVYVLPLRNPIEVAKATGTIARISDNRLVLGAGVGWMPEEFEVYGVDFKTRGKRMNECIEVLRLLWSGGYAEYRGEFFNFDPLQIAPAPTQAVPIYLGGVSKPALRRAGKYAQGWMGNGNVASEMPAVFEHIKASREANNRASEPFDMILAMKDQTSPEQMQAYSEQGATGSFLGFPDHTASLKEKLNLLDAFGGYIQKASR